MARNRQRAKQRQAERRARLAGGEHRAPGAPSSDTGGDEGAGQDRAHDPRAEPHAGLDREPAPNGDRDRGGIAPPGVETETGAGLAASAPPETAGRTDTVLETPPPPPLLDDPSADGEAADHGSAAGEGPEEDQRADGRNRVIAFLIASWGELQRVQWPTRQQTTTLTGIVLGFVVIMGAYLGALDAIFSRLIQLLI
ncbi:MAG: hypothetical protein AVDCRST_MAG17-723 [uncultured Solirubrobacterales bacterium]|uniref:Protein translocase subunit SecE n=1 Tax=uncultured Solirubrobacterales bacterium TaxID=768556 RepID=A0A6J4S6F1_9ACTN|nr:MAG: hypothetical protein AVDCRST_MAG17-723 [uncultured Solirubrobacterales bacterium]